MTFEFFETNGAVVICVHDPKKILKIAVLQIHIRDLNLNEPLSSDLKDNAEVSQKQRKFVTTHYIIFVSVVLVKKGFQNFFVAFLN